jgi:NTE family protein
VSDAGAPFTLDADPATIWHKQALRAFDVATAQARGLRKRRLIADYEGKLRLGAYWGITTLITKYALADSLPVSPAATAYLAAIRTRLDPFSEAEQGRLINGGYALCDAAMRKHVLTEPSRKPPKWPYPAFALDEPIEK